MPTQIFCNKWIENDGIGYRCEVCYEATPLDKFIFYNSCTHGLCKDCKKKWILKGEFLQDHCPICRSCDCKSASNIVKEIIYSGGIPTKDGNKSLIAICKNMIEVVVEEYLKNLEYTKKNENYFDLTIYGEEL
jgi:hypothetical protein